MSAIIFISGGVRSGKSSFAESLAVKKAETTGGRLHYIAAGQSSDPEMKARILKHQRDRIESGLDWQTWEQPVGLSMIANAFNSRDIVLFDCLTTLLNNELFQAGEMWRDLGAHNRLKHAILAPIEKIARSCCLLIIVSNEVLNEPITDNELVFTYMRILGELHQYIAAKANQAFLVEAGIPLLMKGAGEL